MADDVRRYRVFVASPSGLEKEREAFRDTLRDHNEMDSVDRGVLFWPVAWEETLGGIGRPQSLINDEVRSCDYFVMVLWDRWGSRPDKEGQGKYSSGTEEEYHIALGCFADNDNPMRQIVVFFRAVDERQLSDPGEQLKKVLEFRKKLEREKTLLFHTYDEVDSFTKLLRRYLAQWVRDHESGEGGRLARPVVPPEIGPSEGELLGGAVAGEEMVAVPEDTSDEIRGAWRLADEGRLTEAETRFAEQVVKGTGIDALSNYGGFLMRVGRIGQAEVMLKRALEISEKSGQLEAVADQCRRLGLIHTMRGDLDEAEQMQKKALEIDEKLGRSEGMARDCTSLGLIYRRRRDLDKAEEMHKRALKIMEQLGNMEGMAVGYANLGGIYHIRGDLDKAEGMHQKSLVIEEKLGRSVGMARQYGNLGLIYQKRGKLDEAEQMQRKALAIDEKLGRAGGVAIRYSNLGAIYEQRGDMGKTREYYEKARELYEKMGMKHEAQKVERWLKRLKSE
ncbi:MAG: tetratricopeptide repeat protein [Planctomycetota bacterium]|jgi:tetratricopeptide (TPR) repeat protein